MTERKKEIINWKQHELIEEIGTDQYRNSQVWTGNFYFIIGADTQFGYIWPLKKRDPLDWKVEMDRSICAIDKINNLLPRPQFLVICGDLVDTMPNNDINLNQLQVNDFKKVFSRLHPSISLVCVCGNHDIGNSPDEKSVNLYRNTFGQDYFSFWCGGVLFLVINTQYYKDSSKVEKLAKEQDLWLTEKLNKYKDKKKIVFQHIPWFINKIDEDDEYFNIEKTFRLAMVEKLNESGVSHVFCGHYHRNSNGIYKNLEVVTTCAVGAPMGKDPSGLRIVKMYENNVVYNYYSLNEMPSSIIL